MILHCEQHETDYEVDAPVSTPQWNARYCDKVYVIEEWRGHVGCPRCGEEAKQRRFAKNVRIANIPSLFAHKGFDDFKVSTAAQRKH